jgi:PAS domain S-box-containing protein
MSLSQEELKLIIESSPTLIWKSDRNKSIEYFNNAWLKFRGRTLEEECIDGWQEGIHPDDLDKCIHDYHKYFDEKIPFELQYRLKRYDGNFRLIKNKGIPYDDDSGEFAGYIGYCIDITDQKNIEEELRKERKRLSGILEGTNSGTWEWNVQTGETIINDRWAEMIGYTLEEIKPVSQQTWYDHTHPEDRLKSDNLFEAHCNEKTAYYECEIRMRHKNGNWVWILDRGKVITWTDDGQPLLAMGSHQDITIRKESEARLANSETKYRELIENTTDVIYTINTDGIFTYVSNAWKRQLGHERDEVLGESFTKFLHPDDVEASFLKLKEIYYSGEAVTNLEFRIQHKDGTWRWHRTSGSFKKDAIGTIAEFDGLSHDITQEKKDQAEIVKQSALQKLMIDLASSFINVPLENLDHAINNALALTGKHFKVDRSYIFDYEWENGTCRNTYEWCAEGVSPEIDNLQEVPLELLPQWVETHKQGKKMLVADSSKLDGKSGLRAVLEPQGIKSLITLPLMLDEECIGFVGFDSVKDYHNYTKSEEDLLIVFSEMLVNITKRKLADVELLKQKEKAEQRAKKLKEAQKIASLGNWHINLSTDEVTWSEELYNMHGLDPSEPPPPFAQQHKIFTKKSWKLLNEVVSNAIRKGLPYEIELNYKKSDDTVGWVWIKGEAVYNEDKNITALKGIAQDITKRKKLETELKLSKEQHENDAKRLQVATTSAGLGIFEWDIEKNDLMWDDRMYELFGLSKADTQLNFESWSERVHPEDLQAALDDVNKAIKGDQEFNTSFRILHQDGKEYFIKGYAHVIRDKTGRAKKMIGVNMDITQSQLHQRHLEFKNKQLIDFSNILAHNLRAPLVNIGLLIDLIDESEDPDEAKEFVTQLKSVLEHLNEVFNELMESIQIKQDLDIEISEIDLEKRIAKVLNSLSSQIRSYKANVNVDVSPVPRIKYPAKYIDSILNNLISNALKYHSPKREPEIFLKTKRVNRDVILSVEDNGLGLDMSLARKNLFKIRKVFHDHPDAKGFGLFLIKSQIDAMEGDIWVESEIDKGSTFFVKFKNAIV